MRRRIILYIVAALGGILVLCMIIGALVPKSPTPQTTPTEPAQRVATIALGTEAPPTDTPAPSPTKTARPTRPPSNTPVPSITATTIPTKAPTQVPPTKALATAVPATAAPATQSGETMVYITDTGTKYHRANCGHLNDSKHAVTCSWATSHGYTPCSVCDPVCP